MTEQTRATEAVTRITHYLLDEHRVPKSAEAGSGAALVRKRLESTEGLEIGGLRLTVRDGSLIAWTGSDADPRREQLIKVAVDK